MCVCVYQCCEFMGYAMPVHRINGTPSEYLRRNQDFFINITGPPSPSLTIPPDWLLSLSPFSSPSHSESSPLLLLCLLLLHSFCPGKFKS